MNLLAKANQKISMEPKLWPSEEEVVFDTLNAVKADS